MDEARLLEKLRRIEALHAGATTPGERDAAAAARARVQQRLKGLELEDPPVEFRFSMADTFSRRLFVALLRRYELKPFRYRGQRHTTVMCKVPKRFVNETLWPEYEALAKTLREYLDEVTERIIAEAIHKDSSDAVELAALPPGNGSGNS